MLANHQNELIVNQISPDLRVRSYNANKHLFELAQNIDEYNNYLSNMTSKPASLQ